MEAEAIGAPSMTEQDYFKVHIALDRVGRPEGYKVFCDEDPDDYRAVLDRLHACQRP